MKRDLKTEREIAKRGGPPKMWKPPPDPPKRRVDARAGAAWVRKAEKRAAEALVGTALSEMPFDEPEFK